MKRFWQLIIDLKDGLYIGAQAAQLARRGEIQNAKKLYHW